MAGIFTPVNQKLLTNVSVVRLKRGGKRFEIACYPNKVQSWRKGVEKDLGEVLQADRIFMNVSKGVLAKKDELLKCFGDDDEKKIVMMILEKGEVQVSEKERQILLESTFKDIATIVAEKCINPESKIPLTVGTVERAMKEIHYNVHPTKSAKQQALEVIRLLQAKIPIQRAWMRLKINLPISKHVELESSSSKKGKEKEKSGGVSSKEKIMEALQPHLASIESETANESGDISLIVLVDPSTFRTINDIVKVECRSKGSVEVLSFTATDVDVKLDSEK